MFGGFRDFMTRGSVVELAVAVVVGTAFAGVVTAFADDFIGGLIGALGGSPDFGSAGVTVNGSKIIYGSTVTAVINFLIVTAVVYFAVVIPLRRYSDGFDDDTPSDEAVLLTEIRDLLQRQRGTGD
jgi:large conductance mechanosensitive channel